MTRSEVVLKLESRMMLKEGIEVYLDCQECDGIKSIRYKDINNHLYFEVKGDSWISVYQQITELFENEGYLE
jgi:hypothetical protein